MMDDGCNPNVPPRDRWKGSRASVGQHAEACRGVPEGSKTSCGTHETEITPRCITDLRSHRVGAAAFAAAAAEEEETESDACSPLASSPPAAPATAAAAAAALQAAGSSSAAPLPPHTPPPSASTAPVPARISHAGYHMWVAVGAASSGGMISRCIYSIRPIFTPASSSSVALTRPSSSSWRALGAP